jgi:hypothetical protein
MAGKNLLATVFVVPPRAEAGARGTDPAMEVEGLGRLFSLCLASSCNLVLTTKLVWEK